MLKNTDLGMNVVLNISFCWLVRLSLVINMEVPEYFRMGWRGAFGTYVIIRPT